MSGNSCGHFSIEIEQLPVPFSEAPLHVPVHRCRLAERMVIILARSEESRKVALKLVSASSQALLSDGKDIPPEQVVAAFGPDLEAIHAPDCTTERCRLHCAPGYRRLLRDFGFEKEGEQVDESSCVE